MDYKKIIDDMVISFLTEISNYTSIYNKNCLFEKSKYSLFEKGTSDYYKFIQTKKQIEYFFERILVVDTIRQLLINYGVEIGVPDKNEWRGYMVPQYNTCFDEDYDFLFIIGRIGFRLSTKFSFPDMLISKKEIKELETDIKFWITPSDYSFLLNKYNIDVIKILNFSNTRICNPEYVNCDDFFELYLNKEIYNYYVRTISEAVNYSNEIIGYSVVKNLNLKNLSEFKEKKLKELYDFDFINEKYEFIDERKNNYTIPMEDLKIIEKLLKNNRIINSLVGNMNFAKCFLTSEFLFESIKMQKNFDYTSVVCGYLKAVESLLMYYFDSSTDRKDEKYVEYSLKNYNKKKHDIDALSVVVFPHPFKDNFVIVKQKLKREQNHIELKALIEKITYDDRYCHLSKDARYYIYNALDDFRDTCRNEHFHTDNIYFEDYKTVERIRKNTWLCLYYLLGGFQLLNNYELSYYEPEYSQLFKAVNSIPRSIRKFEIVYGENSLKVVRHPFREQVVYSEENATIETKMYFVIVEDFNEIPDFDEEDSLDKFKVHEVSPNNIPNEFFWIGNNGEKHPII